MTAQVHTLPTKPFDKVRLALVGNALREAVPLVSKDAELDLLSQIADRLVGNIIDYDVECFVVRFDGH